MWSTNGLGSRCLAPSNSRIRDVKRILETKRQHLVKSEDTQSTGDANEGCLFYEGWNFNSGNYLFTTDTK